MNLLDILSPDCIKVPLTGQDKREVIDELVDVLGEAGQASDTDALKQAVWSREQTRTTGIGHGLAIPHGRCAGMQKLAMAIGRPEKPMDFEAIDAQPVKLVVLLASPLEKTSDHIHALARVSRLMTMDDFRSDIYAAESPEQIYDLLKARESEVSSA